MFCLKIINTFFEKWYHYLEGNSEELKNGIKILVGQAFLEVELLIKPWNFVLIINSTIVWPTEILLPFLSFSDNLFKDAYIIFQKSVDNFEIVHKTCSIFGLGCSTPLNIYSE